MMPVRPLVIVEAPSALGVAPHGIEAGGDALLRAGLADLIGAGRGSRIEPPPFDWARDPNDGLMNKTAIRDYAAALAVAVSKVIYRGALPMVLGGVCSILLGTLAALRGRGRHGLMFVDGHTDFYQPAAEPRGEVASTELAIATGRGPDLTPPCPSRSTLVLDEDVVVL